MKACFRAMKQSGGSPVARVVTFVMIYSCTSVRDPELNAALLKSVSSMKLLSVKSLRRDSHASTETCLLHGSDFCLSSQEAAGSRSA